MNAHDPISAANELAAKLTARTRHVSLLLGAGTSCAAGLPDVARLLTNILSGLDGDHLELAKSIFENRNLEEGLTRLRRIRALLGDGEEVFSGFSATTAQNLEKKIMASIIAELTKIAPDLTPSINLAAWAAGDFYTRPIEIFTVNYDLVLENGLEKVGASYFDGFVGNLEARFRPELVETRPEATGLPNSFVRLWKLHGSLNWKIYNDGDVRRTGGAVPQDEMAAIYPSDDKYNQSRRVPFLVLQDRLRRALGEPESLTLVCGYSFGDAHLNEILFDAAKRHPRSEIAIFCFDEIPESLADNVSANVSIFGAREAILSGERSQWQPPASARPPVWVENRFCLGDFRALAEFLAKNRRTNSLLTGDPEVVGQLLEALQTGGVLPGNPLDLTRG
ncbi:SIR2 family protein [Paenarthrobacter nitroguajacolicus]|uniref:SIR2 family protein n=1 Tax=Paenarthrobacter nitroguajacolicus TaxID=211146 RepID=UPI0015C19656|nr:SIR2 family protein [Paenarthrobacter nitroguajacolicus]